MRMQTRPSMRASVVFWGMRALAMNCSSSGNFIRSARLSEVLVHEFPVHLLEAGDAVEDITPQIEIIALMDDAVVFADRQLAAAVERGAWDIC